MKKFTPYLFVVVVAVIVGGIFYFQPKQTDTAGEEAVSTEYRNEQYAFSFTHPSEMEVRIREEANRQTDYLGLPVDFFISLRDVEREAKPLNIAFFYAAPGLTVDAFKTALEASDPASVKVTSTEDVEINGLKMTKVINTTALGADKQHYLFDRNGQTVIISVFLTEEPNFEPVLQSLKAL